MESHQARIRAEGELGSSAVLEGMVSADPADGAASQLGILFKIMVLLQYSKEVDQ